MNAIYIDVENKGNPRFIYVISVLNNHPYTLQAGVEFKEGNGEKCLISYGNEKKSVEFRIPEAHYIFGNAESGFEMNSYDASGEMVYSVEREVKEGGLFCAEGLFRFDIFETIFFHLSRYEELTNKLSDHLADKYHFEKKLLLIQNGLEKVPVADELICAFLEKLTSKKIKKGGPVYLSHDIDYIRKFKSPLSIFRKIAGHIKHRKSLKGFGFLWQTYVDYLMNGKDGFDTFDWMLSKKDIDKTIYFLVGGDHAEDNQYDLKDEVFQKAVRLSKDRGYKIGIHPSYESWNNKSLIDHQKQKLESVVGEEIVCSRQHYLNFDILRTPEILQSLGIQEDSSLGYTRYVGYRCGTGFPYLLYDFKNEKAFDVVERPMIFMDVAWLYERLRNGSNELPEFDKIYGGMLFHNSTFDEMGARGIDMKGCYLKYFG